MSTKAPNPVDKYVGSRVRMRRIMLGMSQEKLGEALGLTFQQVQKYEKGTNRVGASRIQHPSALASRRQTKVTSALTGSSARRKSQTWMRFILATVFFPRTPISPMCVKAVTSVSSAQARAP